MNFDSLCEKLLDYLSDDPNFCALTGMNKNLGDLPDPGKNKLIQKQGKLRLLSKLITQIDIDSLSADEKIDLKLIELTIERENVAYELENDGVLEIFKKPQASAMIIDPIYNFLVNDPRQKKYRLVNIISRLKKIPELLISTQRNLNKPLKRWVIIELECLDSLTDLFTAIKLFAKECEFKNMKVLDDAITVAQASVNAYKVYVEGVDCSDNLFIGLDAAKRIVKSNGITMSLKEIHELARSFNIENNDKILKLKAKLISKYSLDADISTEQLQNFLNDKFKCDDILSEYDKSKNTVAKFIKERDLFDIPKNQEFQILKTPSYMRSLIPAGAMCPPLSLRQGLKRSLIFLTIDDSNSSDHNLLTIPPMMIHEGIPGHHLQFSYAANHKSTIRKIFSANDLSEGWATYLEEYILELGLIPELSLEMSFIIKRDVARLGARVAIDLYFMTGDKSYLEIGSDFDRNLDDPFDVAKNLLISICGFSESRADGELNWYSMERGYPMTYLIGNKLIKDLKSKLAMSDKEFHQFILKQGNIPLSFLG